MTNPPQNPTPHRFGRIDTHCHLLPGIDDGCKSIEESLACGKMLIEAGYTHIFCTPHIWPSLPANNRDSITRATAELQDHFDQQGLPLTLLSGAELNVRPQLPQDPDYRLVTYADAHAYVLIDVWADRLPPHFEPVMRFLQSKGLDVILAHPERIVAVQNEPHLVEDFIDLGLLLQGNLQCFADPLGSSTRRTAERFLKQGAYFILGTDCHGPDTLPSRLRGLENARLLAGDSVIDQLTKENPQRLIGRS